MNDEAVIKQALEGDREAFTLLVEAYWPVAEHVAHGILSDAQLAQDVAQDVFADVYMKRARYQPSFSFHAFVSAMARYKSIDVLRKRGKPFVPVDPEMYAATTQTPEGVFVQELFRTALYSAVEKLSDSQRQLLEAYTLQNRSYQEIAAEMKMTVA